MIVRVRLCVTMIAPDAMAAALAALPGEAPETLAGLRHATERWAHRHYRRTPTAVAPLDAALAGGWPQGKVSEVVGAPSSGRTALAVTTVAAATARGELVAWLDAGDALDPAAACAAGVALDQVLWLRPQGWEQTVRAAELVLEVGGFTVVVADLAVPGGGRSGALRLRLARAAERAGAVVLALAGRPWTGALAGAVVELGRGVTLWGGEMGSPRWLAGLRVSARVSRGAGGSVPLELLIGHAPGRRQERPGSSPGWGVERATDYGPRATVDRIPDPGPRTPSSGRAVARTPDPGSRIPAVG